LQSKVDEFISDELGLAPQVTDERAQKVRMRSIQQVRNEYPPSSVRFAASFSPT
jgi:hypothetical protein